MTTSKGGRPSKKNAEVVEVLLRALEDGMPVDKACDLAQIDRATAYNWMKSDPGFSAKVRYARAKAVHGLVNQVKREDASGPWKILRSLDPKNFGDEIRIIELDEERDDEAEGMGTEDLEKTAR